MEQNTNLVDQLNISNAPTSPWPLAKAVPPASQLHLFARALAQTNGQTRRCRGACISILPALMAIDLFFVCVYTSMSFCVIKLRKRTVLQKLLLRNWIHENCVAARPVRSTAVVWMRTALCQRIGNHLPAQTLDGPFQAGPTSYLYSTALDGAATQRHQMPAYFHRRKTSNSL